MAERIIVALKETGKPKVAQDGSALDVCSVCWQPDMHMKKHTDGQLESSD